MLPFARTVVKDVSDSSSPRLLKTHLHVAYLGEKVSPQVLQRTAFSVQLQPDGSVQEVRCALPEGNIQDAWLEKTADGEQDVLVVLGKFPHRTVASSGISLIRQLDEFDARSETVNLLVGPDIMNREVAASTESMSNSFAMSRVKPLKLPELDPIHSDKDSIPPAVNNNNNNLNNINNLNIITTNLSGSETLSEDDNSTGGLSIQAAAAAGDPNNNNNAVLHKGLTSPTKIPRIRQFSSPYRMSPAGSPTRSLSRDLSEKDDGINMSRNPSTLSAITRPCGQMLGGDDGDDVDGNSVRSSPNNEASPFLVVMDELTGGGVIQTANAATKDDVVVVADDDDDEEMVYMKTKLKDVFIGMETQIQELMIQIMQKQKQKQKQ